MADTQPPTPDHIASLTREELVELLGLCADECQAFHELNSASNGLADFNLRHWRTALARAERAERLLDATEDQVKDVGRSLNKAMDQCNTLGAEITTLRAQAATDAATIDRLKRELMEARGLSSEIPNSSPTATPPAAPDGAPRFKVGDKVSKFHGDPSVSYTITAVESDGRYSLKYANGTLSSFRWSEAELRPFSANAANAQWAEKGVSK